MVLINNFPPERRFLHQRLPGIHQRVQVAIFACAALIGPCIPLFALFTTKDRIMVVPSLFKTRFCYKIMIFQNIFLILIFFFHKM